MINEITKTKTRTKKKKMTKEEKLAAGWQWVFSPYITRYGKRIYHPTGGVFKFLGDPNWSPRTKKKK